MENWKDIKGYEGIYQVSNIGRVRSLNRTIAKNNRWGGESKQPYPSKYIAPFIRNNGYSFVGLSHRSTNIHRLVAIAFIPNPENKPCVNHINGVKTDNRVENLEWCTYKENIRHAFRNSLIQPKKGESHYYAKLTAPKVLEILEKAKQPRTFTSIAKEYNISHGTVVSIIRGKSWKSIAAPFLLKFDYYSIPRKREKKVHPMPVAKISKQYYQR